MKKFTGIFSFVILLISIICIASNMTPWSQSQPSEKVEHEENEKEEGGPQNPGWFAQWLAMKAGPDGKIPVDLIRRMNSERALHKTAGSTGLTSISQLGPSNVGGRTRSLVIDAADNDHIVAAGVSGGIWHTTNQGLTWSSLDDRMATLAVTGIAQDPSALSNWYACTGEPRGNSAGIPGSGLFKSTDNGATWTQLSSSLISAFDYTWKIVVDPTAAGRIYVASKSEGLWRSTNAGTSWTQVFISGTYSDVSDVEVFPSGAVIIGVNGIGVYKSPTGNPGSFVKSTSVLPSSAFRRVELAYCAGTPTVVYAAIEDSAASSYYTGLQDMYKSTDAGVTWSNLSNPDDDYLYFFSFPWYSLLLTVKPNDPNFVLCGVGDLAYTVDGGATWDLASYSHADNHTAVFDPTDPTTFYVGNDGGIYAYYTPTMGFANLPLNNAYEVTQYYAGYFYPTMVSAIAGAQDNGTHKMASGSSVATDIFGGDGSYCAVNQQNDLISYVSYQYGQIYRADDSNLPYPTYNDILFGSAMDTDSDGNVDDGSWFINPFEIHQGDGDQLYYVTNSRVFRTGNGGSSWLAMTNALGASPYAIGIAHQEVNPTVYIGGSNALFYYVNNAAASSPGSEVDLSATVPGAVTNDFLGCLTVHPADASVVYACFTNYSAEPRIWRVSNANTGSPTWTDISGDLPVGLPVNWVEVHPNAPDDYIMAATDNGLYVTQNGGINWVEETSLPNVAIHQIRLRKTDQKLFIPTHGRGMWLANLPVIVNTEDPVIAGLEVYPNPVSDVLSVTTTAAHPLPITLMDVKGNVMRSLTLAAGTGQLDVSGLPSGIYLLKAGNEVKKIVVR